MRETKFKNTEVGMIPEEWEVRPISNTFSFICNNTLSRDQIGENGVVRNVHYGDILIKYGYILDVQRDGVPYINQSIRTIAKNPLRDGDILMADTAEDEIVGRCCEIRNICGEDVETGLHSFGLRPNHEYAPNFLGYAFNSSQYHNQLIPHIQGTKVSSVSKSAVSKTYLCCPTSFTEQRRIANVLSNVDSLISSLDKLIEKKKAIKQGAMQQLLTGKKRLAGFTDNWSEVVIGELGRTYNGLSGKSAKDFGHGNARYVTFLNVLNNPIINTSIFESVDVMEEETQNRVRKGDLLFNTSSETPSEVGICAAMLEDIDNLYLNSFCFGFRPTSLVNPLYMAYWFRSAEGRDLMTMLAQGSTRYNLSKENMMKSVITIPSVEEQTAIANILTDMDKEISALEQKRAKYESIKQGMMQQLLTGKIRLI